MTQSINNSYHNSINYNVNNKNNESSKENEDPIAQANAIISNPTSNTANTIKHSGDMAVGQDNEGETKKKLTLIVNRNQNPNNTLQNIIAENQDKSRDLGIGSASKGTVEGTPVNIGMANGPVGSKSRLHQG